jgi:hypothetical protein
MAQETMKQEFEKLRYKVNSKYIVHETIEGETIIMNLRNGFYYSFDGIGPVIWDLLEKNNNILQITRFVQDHFPTPERDISKPVSDFIKQLADNDLVAETGSPDFEAETLSPEELKKLMGGEVPEFIEPRLNKYSDMQNVLLLDPIHDVDEKGWPDAIKSEE